MNCNRCHGVMRLDCPEDGALIPVMVCDPCGRMVPRTGVKHRPVTRAAENRAMRAARRRRLV